ncbi:sigma-70 family RNA polymerase sigma factor [Halobacillus sp. A1]|uniref:sigma-70 family RNA polymerase sigma factor n=1 Tax=Halobacillus sp. A1 TaxID=2880262 RepID=UPI0020A6A6F1|nr:sigma-70 family RNA polymerase sigma factor [Halobacillus sp. A1]MCP3031483.1 sigma-70 family RNA polymerase sigma factor [Halobacillus sp. A1]
MSNEHLNFERVVKENQRLIYYHIHSLRINDSEGTYFSEGLVALWKAYESYDKELGKFSTFLSWKIRNALIDRIRKESTQQKHQLNYLQQTSATTSLLTEDYIEDHHLWEQVKSLLTQNQWKWVYYFIIHDLSVEQIASLEKVSKDSVKNWGRHARRILRERLSM